MQNALSLRGRGGYPGIGGLPLLRGAPTDQLLFIFWIGKTMEEKEPKDPVIGIMIGHVLGGVVGLVSYVVIFWERF
jgi:hypothetical protein